MRHVRTMATQLAAQMGSLPFDTVIYQASLRQSGSINTAIFIHLSVFTSGSEIAITSNDLQFATGWYAVLGQLTNIPTDTLIDMLFVIANGEVALTASDVAELEQIQRELQRRGGSHYWSSRAFD